MIQCKESRDPFFPLHVAWALKWIYNLPSEPRPFLAQSHNSRCLVLSRLGGTLRSRPLPMDEISLKHPPILEEGLPPCFILELFLPL